MELLKWLSSADVMSQERACNSCPSKLRLCLTKDTGEGRAQSLTAVCTAFPIPPEGSEVRRELLAQGGRRTNESLRLALPQKPVLS